MASAMPVLPDVASTTVCPGASAPVDSACSMIAIARRSLTDASGLKNSHFTYIVAWREPLDAHDGSPTDRVEDTVVDHVARFIGSLSARSRYSVLEFPCSTIARAQCPPARRAMGESAVTL